MRGRNKGFSGMSNARTLSVTDARSQFADVVNSVAYSNNPTVITKNGKNVAAVVPYGALEVLARLEAMFDIENAEKSLAEYKRKGGISLDELKKKLGAE